MQNDIVSKLNTHLSKDIKSESDVVYILVQIRKLLEKISAENRPSSLWMYCNWALHVDLDRDKTTLNFLKKVDAYIQNNIAGHVAHETFTFNDEHHLFRDLLHQDSLRKELIDIAKHFNIDFSSFEDDKKWPNFLDKLAGIIEDGSLSASAENLRAIKRVVFSKPIFEDINKNGVSVIWDIYLIDGRQVSATLVAKSRFDLFSITIK